MDLTTPERQHALLVAGTQEVLPEGELLRRLRAAAAEGRPLRVKQGFDPTAPDIHLGHTVGLRKLRQFQALGHQIVLIVGDYTGMVGDPSGRSKTRPQLTHAQVEANARTYLEQFFRVLERDPPPPARPVEVHRNGEWFAPMAFMDVMRLASQVTVARVLERDDFQTRFREGQPLGVHELFYPLMQGYDSVAIRADVELGATEQKFNLLVGRGLQEQHGQPPQVVMTLPVLPGLDGRQRMSKSLGNYIGITDPPGEMFGKVMSLPDDVLGLYWRLVADADADTLARVERELAGGEVNPMRIKQALGARLVTLYHGAAEAEHAQRNFDTQFRRGGVPDDLPLVELPAGEIWIQHLLVQAGLARSGSDARRAVEQERSVEIDGRRVEDAAYRHVLAGAAVLRRGRRMVRIAPKG